MNICSILIPSRKRVRRLINTIESVKATSNESRVEICVRIDSDDYESIESIPALMRIHQQVKFLVGPRLGYERLHDYYNELARISDSTWFFVLNDDITLEGKGWDERLAELRTDQLAMPESYKLGLSTYTNFGCGYVCPIVPLAKFRKHGPMGIPVDTWWMEKIGGGMEKKSNAAVVPGLCVNHQRDKAEYLKYHRSN